MDNNKINDEELDAVAGGMGNVEAGGSNVGNDQTFVDQSEHNSYVGGDVTYGDKVGGDKTLGNKVDTKVTTNVNISSKKSVF